MTLYCYCDYLAENKQITPCTFIFWITKKNILLLCI